MCVLGLLPSCNSAGVLVVLPTQSLTDHHSTAGVVGNQWLGTELHQLSQNCLIRPGTSSHILEPVLATSGGSLDSAQLGTSWCIFTHLGSASCNLAQFRASSRFLVLCVMGHYRHPCRVISFHKLIKALYFWPSGYKLARLCGGNVSRIVSLDVPLAKREDARRCTKTHEVA